MYRANSLPDDFLQPPGVLGSEVLLVGFVVSPVSFVELLFSFLGTFFLFLYKSFWVYVFLVLWLERVHRLSSLYCFLFYSSLIKFLIFYWKRKEVNSRF